MGTRNSGNDCYIQSGFRVFFDASGYSVHFKHLLFGDFGYAPLCEAATLFKMMLLSQVTCKPLHHPKSHFTRGIAMISRICILKKLFACPGLITHATSAPVPVPPIAMTSESSPTGIMPESAAMIVISTATLNPIPNRLLRTAAMTSALLAPPSLSVNDRSTPDNGCVCVKTVAPISSSVLRLLSSNSHFPSTLAP